MSDATDPVVDRTQTFDAMFAFEVGTQQFAAAHRCAALMADDDEDRHLDLSFLATTVRDRPKALRAFLSGWVFLDSKETKRVVWLRACMIDTYADVGADDLCFAVIPIRQSAPDNRLSEYTRLATPYLLAPRRGGLRRVQW